jgi:hypothetical protein
VEQTLAGEQSVFKTGGDRLIRGGHKAAIKITYSARLKPDESTRARHKARV